MPIFSKFFILQETLFTILENASVQPNANASSFFLNHIADILFWTTKRKETTIIKMKTFPTRHYVVLETLPKCSNDDLKNLLNYLWQQPVAQECVFTTLHIFFLTAKAMALEL